jgi:charged multivesicular body protein 7
MSSKASVYDPGWLPTRIAAYVVGRPLWWALQQMGVVSDSGSSSRQNTDHTKDGGWWGMYVLLPLLERAADEVVRIQEARMASPGDALYTVDSFRQVFAGVLDDAEEREEGEGEERLPMRERDAEVLLKFLERDRGALVVDKDVRRIPAILYAAIMC